VNTTLLRSIAKWFVFLALLGVALLYLNGALYAAWLSGGPPTPYPIGWLHRAQGQACFFVAALVFAVAAFRLIGKIPALDRAGVALLTVAVCIALAPYVGRHVLADSCLDNGGRWSNETLQCEK
jgi:hypothetical protein